MLVVAQHMQVEPRAPAAAFESPPASSPRIPSSTLGRSLKRLPALNTHPCPPTFSQPGEVEGLRQLFQALDEDATGTISAQQLGAALAHMGEQARAAGRDGEKQG